MSNLYIFFSILIIALVTVGLRFLPFLVFNNRVKVPAFIEYLGKVLPFSVMGVLVVYCLKDIKFDSMDNFIPSLLGVATTVLVHLWKENTIYSIISGTLVYMVLIRII